MFSLQANNNNVINQQLVETNDVKCLSRRQRELVCRPTQFLWDIGSMSSVSYSSIKTLAARTRCCKGRCSSHNTVYNCKGCISCQFRRDDAPRSRPTRSNTCCMLLTLIRWGTVEYQWNRTVCDIERATKTSLTRCCQVSQDCKSPTQTQTKSVTITSAERANSPGIPGACSTQAV